MPENGRLCVVIRTPTLGPSETFLHAHVAHLADEVPPLLGRQATRRAGLTEGEWLLPQGMAFRGWRWLARKSGLTTLARQDTHSVVKYFRHQRVDVVMAEYGPTGLHVMEACRLADVPLVAHFHGWDAYVLASEPDQAQEYRRLFEQSVAIVVVSRHMQAHVRSLGAPPDKVIWNPCGADVKNVPLARPADNAPVYVTVGRPTPKKAPMVTLQAFARIIRELPAARLKMVGGAQDAALVQAARELGVEDAVSLTGPVPHDAVLDQLREARCYLHPSVTAPDGDMEGTPVSVMEAMAAGLPVVATRHGGIIDLLEGTTAGLLVEENDVEATAEAMLVYGRDPARAAADGAEGRRLMGAHWAMEHSIRKLARIIELARARDAAGIAELAVS